MADDDPFAELTRIMGFDPREPVGRPAAAPATVAAFEPRRQVSQPDHHAAADDLEIDLERELLGEFADDPSQHGAWEVAADHSDHPEPVEPHADASRDARDDWAYQQATDMTGMAAEHVEEQPAYEAQYARAEPVSSDDWEVDLAADLLSGVEPVAEAVHEDHRVDAGDQAESATAHHESVREAPRTASVEAYREPFASEVDLPPIPLSRAAEPVAVAASEEDHDAGLELALEHELGAALSDPVDDGGWESVVDGWHADDDHEVPVSAAATEAADPVSDHEDAVEHAAPEHREHSEDWDGHDPYAALAALSAGLHAGSQRGQAAFEEHPVAAGRTQVAAEVPDIETVEVPEQVVPVAEEFDIPEIHFEEQAPAAAGYDDIDAEFANLLNEMNSLDRSTAATAPMPGWQPAQPHAAQHGQPILVPAAAPESGRRYAVDADYLGAARGDTQTELADMEFAFDPDDAEDTVPPAMVARRPRSRGYLIAAALASVAVLGGVAAFMLPFGGGENGSEIALVAADPSPSKVRPENPGGVVIPNQDNKVYDRVAGAGGNETPTQEKLLQSAEEPLELPMPRDDEAAELAPFPGDVDGMSADALFKGEDRIAPQDADEGVDTTMEVAAVPPRKVRTMVVKADGTLVAREVPVQDASLSGGDDAAALDPIASATTAADVDASLPVDEPVAERPAAQAAAPAAGATEAPASPAPASNAASTPKAAPIAPSRPSDQPVDIVGEVQSNQVAALAPAAAAGAWSMQIASQPNEASAQASFRDLQRRYGSVLEGRQANIVKADIPGKGTFWRVRVPAGTRAEAVKLCETYKAAGGSCFVSK